jgi:hypothetical protein
MHKLGIAINIAEIVEHEVTNHHCGWISVVALWIGRMTSADHEAPRFGVETATRDMPLIYTGMFRRSLAMVIDKIDLLGSSDFNMQVVKRNALSINGQLKIADYPAEPARGWSIGLVG